MLKKGSKLKFYRFGTEDLYGELTIRNFEPAAEGRFKVWFQEPPGEGTEPWPLVAVDKDGVEYGVSSGWKNSRDDWGYILQPI